MIVLECSGAEAVVRKQDVLTCGMVGAQVRFRFDKAWDGLAKTAVFRGGKVVRDGILTGDTAVIPHEVLNTPGMPLYIGVWGADETGTLVIPTVWASTSPVQPGAAPSGDPGAEPTLPIWAQIRALADSNRRDVDKLVGQVGELDAKVSAPVRAVTVSLPASGWEGSGSLYAQKAAVPDLTAGSQVNLTPTVAQMAAFCEKDCCFLTENDGGSLTVWLLGEKPTQDYVMKANVVEVRT